LLYVQRKKLANQLNDPVSVQELITETERLNIVDKAPLYVAKFLFTDQLVEEIRMYRILLYQVCFGFNAYLLFVFKKKKSIL